MLKITFELPALCGGYLTYEKVIQPSRFVSYQSGDRTERREYPGKTEIVGLPGISLRIGKKKDTLLVSIDETTLHYHCEIEAIHNALRVLQLSLDNFFIDPKTIQEKVSEISHCLANYLKLDSGKHLSKYIAGSMLIWFVVFMLVFPIPMFVVSLMLAMVIGLITGSIFSIGKDVFDAKVAHKELYKVVENLEIALLEAPVVGRIHGPMGLPTISDESDSDNVLRDQERQDKSTDYSNGSTLIRTGIFKGNPGSNSPTADSHIPFNGNAKHF